MAIFPVVVILTCGFDVPLFFFFHGRASVSFVSARSQSSRIGCSIRASTHLVVFDARMFSGLFHASVPAGSHERVIVHPMRSFLGQHLLLPSVHVRIRDVRHLLSFPRSNPSGGGRPCPSSFDPCLPGGGARFPFSFPLHVPRPYVHPPFHGPGARFAPIQQTPKPWTIRTCPRFFHRSEMRSGRAGPRNLERKGERRVPRVRSPIRTESKPVRKGNEPGREGRGKDQDGLEGNERGVSSREGEARGQVVGVHTRVRPSSKHATSDEGDGLGDGGNASERMPESTFEEGVIRREYRRCEGRGRNAGGEVRGMPLHERRTTCCDLDRNNVRRSRDVRNS